MDEYDYLEAQLEAGKPGAAPPGPPPAPPSAPKAEEERSSRSESRREGKSSKRSRSRSRERRSSRRRSGSREDRKRSRSRDHGGSGRRPDGYGAPRDFRNGRDDRGGRGPHFFNDRRDLPRPAGGYMQRGRDDRREEPRRSKERDPTPPEVRLQREKEQELKDLERTVRTIMVMNLNLKATERDIFEHFCAVGAINDIRLICDKHSKRSKGISYIEYSTVESAISALTLNASVMMGHPLIVKPSEAEKNLAWEQQQQAKQSKAATTQLLNKMGGTAPGVKLNPIKLQILNLHPDIAEDDLKELFLPFGEINYVHVVRGLDGASTGEAYVQYADQPMAVAAIDHWNGRDLAGQALTVQVAPLYIPPAMPLDAMAGGLPPPPPMPPGGLPGPPPLPPGMSYPGMLAPGSTAPVTIPPPPPGAAPEPPVVQNINEMDDLDDSDNKAFKLSAQSRAALMSRLATSAGLQAPPSFLAASGTGGAAGTGAAGGGPALNVSQTVLIEQGMLGPASPIPTPCLLLKNMFSDADKAEANWQAEVAEDVKGEAAKFGPVLHCHVDPNSKGHVYLKFATQAAAEAASRALHGRYYAGKQIVVSYQFAQPYNAHFGLHA